MHIVTLYKLCIEGWQRNNNSYVETEVDGE